MWKIIEDLKVKLWQRQAESWFWRSKTHKKKMVGSFQKSVYNWMKTWQSRKKSFARACNSLSSFTQNLFWLICHLPPRVTEMVFTSSIFPVVLYSLARCEHVSWRCRDQPVQFMSNSTFASRWRKKHMCVGTDLGSQAKGNKSSLFSPYFPHPTIFPLQHYFPEYFLPEKTWKHFIHLKK